VLSNTSPDLISLTELKIGHAVFHMAKRKTCGPDEFPTEFSQQYWSIIKQDLIDVLRDFYDNKEAYGVSTKHTFP
jgi:hypothetical protein